MSSLVSALMYIDFKELNKQTLNNMYPIPIVEYLLDELIGSIYFSKIDQRLVITKSKLDQ